MSTVITDKLSGKASAGNITITSEGGAATMQLQQGVIKSWISHDDGTSTHDSFNVSTLTDVAVGRYQHTVTNNFSTADYMTMINQSNGGQWSFWTGGESARANSTSIYEGAIYESGAYQDADHTDVMAFGDLA